MKKIILLTLITCIVSCQGDRLPIQTAVYPGKMQTKELPRGLDPDAVPLADISLVKAIESYFQQALKAGQIAGAAVAVVGKEGLVYQGGFGKSDARTGSLVNEHTVFRIGSLSKGFGGILTGTLVDEGLLSWEDKVQEAIPEFQLSDAAHAKKVTLGHLLSHSSGMPYHTYTNLVEAGHSLSEITQELDKVNNLQAIGQIFSYQNATFALSGSMCTAASGIEMEQLLKDRLFEPLGMNNASANYESMIETKNKSFPHRGGQGQWWPATINHKYYNAIAAGGINASVSDMSQWLYLLLGERDDVISDSTLNEVLSPVIATRDYYRYYNKWDGHDTSYYGYGWRIHTFDQPTGRDTIIHHGGYVNGYRSEIGVSKKDDIGICVLFNNSNGLSRTCIPDILELYRKNKAAKVKEPTD